MKATNRFPTSVSVIWLVILVALMPVLICFLCFFAIYRVIIKIILKIKYGKDFYGLLNGLDTFHIVGDTTTNFMMPFCLIVRCEKYTSEEFYEITREVISKPETLAKARTLFRKSFGYPYLIKQKRELYDCTSKMEIVGCPGKRIDKQQLYELLSYHYNRPMPHNGMSPYHFLIGTQPINWKDDECDYYPVMIKVHHAIADGISVLKTFMAMIADKLQSSEECKNRLRVPKQNQKVLFKIVNNVWEILKMFIVILIFYPTYIVVSHTYKGNDANILRNRSLVNQSVLKSNCETNIECVSKIKRIKQKFPGTAFTTILITTISACLDNYFKKSCSRPPRYITISIPAKPNSSELRYVTPDQTSLSEVKLINDYSLLSVRVPIAIENIDNFEFPSNKQLINRLNLINKEVDLLKRSFEYQVSRAFMQLVCAVLPELLLKLILDTIDCTTVVSIIAGPPRMTYAKEQLVISNMVGWVPHLHRIGTSICIFTYDGRLQIGVNADKALIPDASVVQNIADDIYKYLDILEKEVEEYYN
ncbi:hypothetical protein ILUMI_04342 [Ignelater luminosus]|uniref:O-acyltransferase WSD1 C-terminal domain-containing protein n=1 Tax=Ignelater luminosus TaxID=2038154 RepID=A0A8K0GL98_IGNLU|nr:hypothetical protein ILUMI_04342 [Ignelater luminosus]